MIKGKISFNQYGSATVIDDKYGEIFIYKKNTQKSLHGDIVEVDIIKSKNPEVLEGTVISILEESKREFVGRLEKSKKFAFFIPDSKRVAVDFFIPLEKCKQYKNGEKVLATVHSWGEKSKSPNGKIIKSLGFPGENDAEMMSILYEYGLDINFPQEVENEAELISPIIPEKEINKRRDFREVLTVSIDPENAKDKDDALSYRILENGNREIGIHIADVSHYVSVGSEIEKEAFKRSYSVYLVDRVVPMLPERLCTQICSLNEGTDKLAFSFVFEFDDKSNIIREWFGKTVVRMDASISYEKAQGLIDNPDSSDLSNTIIELDKLAKELRTEREIIEFKRNEYKFVLDEEYKPIEVYIKQSIDTNKLIEEFMLLTNRRVAEFVYKNKKKLVYRTHDKPSEEKLEELHILTKTFGYSFNNNSSNIKEELNKLLKEVKGKPEENLISHMAIRVMSKAKCDYVEQHEHWGLGMEHYAWYTSPIRRISDYMNHRILENILNNNKDIYSDSDLDDKCKYINQKEIMASKAERDSIKFKQAEFLLEKIGECFDAIISGVTRWGVYCEIKDNHCEGLLNKTHLNKLGFEINEETKTLSNHTKKLRIGDNLLIRVESVSLLKKEINFELM